MSSNKKLTDFEFPNDLAKKGNEMTKAYYNLYILENFLRLFIEKISMVKYGKHYWQELNINKDIDVKIENRRKNEKKHKWLSLRGNSVLFYTDLDDLRNIIINNWDIFRDRFPNQEFITSRINDLCNIRNRIAHNSYINDIEQQTLEVLANNIYMQLESHFRFFDKSIFSIKKEKVRSKSSNKFEELQKLFYDGDYKKILIDWYRYSTLFPNTFFRKSLLSKRLRVVNLFDNSKFEIWYDGNDFKCRINMEGISKTNDDLNFSDFTYKYFKKISDSLRNI